ncbi:hypothetical protein LOC68_26305 [Blastopirellula sp. JC732]|uniref:Carboxypeptidase regulatory-like domain-containing protein n=1 Tax=Blastopirellula sediminis TaxID=2894196 RepID=A0A9X1MR03_9BACT|nr:hypothetical protein [Blastopirellula sediminis]MCC9604778.1 hypothetical protein [Blastopirellula sediminis]MCC9631923.1 hypothetical protein [Blastopirellula sediminis]
MKKTIALFAVYLLAAASGCGSQTSSVTGMITLSNGSPVTRGRIIFTSPELQVSANGSIESDGSYQLSTYDLNDGTLPGNYVVTVVAMEPDNRQLVGEELSTKDRAMGRSATRRVGAEPKSIVALKYSNPNTSGLTAEVTRGSCKIDFVLDPLK